MKLILQIVFVGAVLGLILVSCCHTPKKYANLEWSAPIYIRYEGETYAGGYPRMAELPDGSLLVTVDRPETQILSNCTTNMLNTIAVWKSKDRGATWEFPNPHADNNTAVPDPDPEDPTASVVNGFPLVLPDGTILLAYADVRYTNPNSLGTSDYFHIKIRRSQDGGVSWHDLSTAASVHPGGGILEPFMYLGSDGDVRLIYSRGRRTETGGILQAFSEEKRSYDGGETWPTTNHGGDLSTEFSCQMPAVVKADNGKHIMVFETNKKANGNSFAIGMLESEDDGVTWPIDSFKTIHSQNYGDTTGYGAGAPYIVKLHDERLLCLFQEKDTHDPLAPVECTYMISEDNGLTWSQKRRLFSGPWNAFFVDSQGYTYVLTTGVDIRKTIKPIHKTR